MKRRRTDSTQSPFGARQRHCRFPAGHIHCRLQSGIALIDGNGVRPIKVLTEFLHNGFAALEMVN
jgi:hypothetical protein